jgi:hypothetical protein
MRLRDAYSLADPIQRQSAVLKATEDFLNEPSTRYQSDEIAASVYSQIVFSSGGVTLSDPAQVVRKEEIALVGLPDGLGVYLFELGETGSNPLLISPWSGGLVRIQALWRENDIGVLYTSSMADHIQQHFALIAYAPGGWKAAWRSEDSPDWWFNSRDARIYVSPDLTTLEVEGSGTFNTPIFDETDSPLKQVFRIRWVRTADNTYRIDPPPEGYGSREAWLSEVSNPSAYGTLVQYLQDLRNGDALSAQSRVVDTSVTRDAESFGLARPERLYTVIAYDETHISFRDNRGAFMATFVTSPDAEGWLIQSIVPLGAAND